LAILGVRSNATWRWLRRAEGFIPTLYGFVCKPGGGAEARKNSLRIGNGGLKGRLQAGLPATQKGQISSGKRTSPAHSWSSR